MGMVVAPAQSTVPAPYGAHDYWILEIDANNGDAGFTRLGSFVFKDAGGSIIPTTGGTPISGGSGTDTVAASNAFDGNDGTTWQRSSPTNTKIGYQFASAVSPATIELTVDSAIQAPMTCRLRHSDDGITYTTAFEIWEPSWTGGTTMRSWPQDFTGGKYKAFGWRVTANNGDQFYYQNEAEMHATLGGADICNGGVAFCSDNSGTGADVANLFDNNNGSTFGWNSLATPAQIPGYAYYAFATTVPTPAEFSLTENSDATRGWKDFTFFGTNDGIPANFATLKTLTGVTWSSTLPQTQTFAVP